MLELQHVATVVFLLAEGLTRKMIAPVYAILFHVIATSSVDAFVKKSLVNHEPALFSEVRLDHANEDSEFSTR